MNYKRKTRASENNGIFEIAKHFNKTLTYYLLCKIDKKTPKERGY